MNSIEIARIDARNPSTNPNLLRKLGLSEDRDIRERVATNPNTPIEVLLELGIQFPEQVLSNPVLLLLLLENLNLIEQMPSATLIRIKIALHPKTPVHILEQLAQDENYSVREAVIENPNLPKSVLEQVLLQDNKIKYLQLKPEGLPIVLTKYTKNHDFPWSVIALLHPKIPQEILEEKALSFHWLERYAVTKNINTPKDWLELLAQDVNRIVRASAKAMLQERY